MATEKISIIQGDSYEEDYPHETLTDLTGFSGSWAIVDMLPDGTPDPSVSAIESSGNLILSDDKTRLYLRITPDKTADIPLSPIVPPATKPKPSYYLITQIVNESISFKRETHQYLLTILPQGILT